MLIPPHESNDIVKEVVEEYELPSREPVTSIRYAPVVTPV
jgi:hypothetical protein